MFSLRSHDTQEAQSGLEESKTKSKSPIFIKRDHLDNNVKDPKRRYTMKKRNA